MNYETDSLETSAQFRAALGGISAMTEYRWSKRFPDFPVPIFICKRKFYRPAEREAFVAARAAEREEAPDAPAS